MLQIIKYSCLSLLTFCVFLLPCESAFAQKKPVLSEEEQVAEAVSLEVSQLLKSPAFLKKKTKKFEHVKGYVVVDIAVVQQGKLSSFFKVDSDIKDIDFFEFLADTMLAQKFNFKLPKQQRYKIRQTLEF